MITLVRSPPGGGLPWHAGLDPPDAAAPMVDHGGPLGTADQGAELSYFTAPFTAPDGTELFYRDYGAGRPVVFIHSMLMSSDMWQPQMLHLAGHGLRAVAYDRRGHGRSDDPGTGYDFDTLASDLAALLDRLGLTGVTLVGHSMGGGEVIRYLSRRGARAAPRRLRPVGRGQRRPVVRRRPARQRHPAPGEGGHDPRLDAGVAARRGRVHPDQPGGRLPGRGKPNHAPRTSHRTCCTCPTASSSAPTCSNSPDHDRGPDRRSASIAGPVMTPAVRQRTSPGAPRPPGPRSRRPGPARPARSPAPCSRSRSGRSRPGTPWPRDRGRR